jgi:N-acetylglucosaminyl-diphospho-decaprenol L-rhamnosyltransferase
VSTPSVSVVIVSYNSRAYLDECLKRIVSVGREVVLADNASSDGTVDFVRERYPDVHVLAFDENLGFGRANNEAVKVTSSEYLLLLNPDAWPVDDAVERLVCHVAEHPDVGIAGPKLINPNGTLQRSIHGRPTALWRGNPAIPGRASPRRRRPLGKAVFYVRWIPGRRSVGSRNGGRTTDRRMILTRQFLKGAVLLVRREAFEAVRGFDPDFFLFAEEIDLCHRIRMAGWTIEYVPGMSFVHVLGSSTGLEWTRAYREQLRSHLRLIAKHEGTSRAEFARRFLVVALRARALRRGRDGRPFADAARWLASTDLQALLGAGGGSNARS